MRRAGHRRVDHPARGSESGPQAVASAPCRRHLLGSILVGLALIGCGTGDGVTGESSPAAEGSPVAAMDAAQRDATPSGTGAADVTSEPVRRNLADDPEALAAFQEVRELAAARGNRVPPDAVDALWRLHREYPASADVFVLLNNVLIARRDWRGVYDLYRGREQLSERERITLGKVTVQLGRFDEAVDLLVPLAERAPEDADLAYNAGLALRRAGRPDDAASLLERALPALRAASHVDGLTVRALLHADAGENQRAEELFREALEADPDYVPALNGLARVMAASGREEEARNLLDEVDRIHAATTGEEARRMRLSAQAEALEDAFAERDLDRAEQLVTSMLEAAEERELLATLHRYAAQIHAAKGQPEEARSAQATAEALTGSGADP